MAKGKNIKSKPTNNKSNINTESKPNTSTTPIKLDFIKLQNKVKNSDVINSLKTDFTNCDINDKFDISSRINTELNLNLDYHNYFKTISAPITQSWLEKYRILDLDTNHNYIKHKQDIDNWINFFYNKQTHTVNKQKVTNKPFLLLHGPPGTGKTTLAHSIYKSLDFDIIEINSSECRNEAELNTYLDTSYQSVLSNKKNPNTQMGLGIIMDEIDGISNNECSGLHMILSNIFFDKIPVKNAKSTVKYPVIATCNSIKESKLKQLLKYAVVLEINDITESSLLNLVTKINLEEKLELTETIINSIVANYNRDYRECIKYLDYCYTTLLDIKNKQSITNHDTSYLNTYLSHITNDINMKLLFNFDLYINNDIVSNIEYLFFDVDICYLDTNKHDIINTIITPTSCVTTNNNHISGNVNNSDICETRANLINMVIKSKCEYIYNFIVADYHQVYYILYENIITTLTKLFSILVSVSNNILYKIVNNIIKNDYIISILDKKAYNDIVSRIKDTEYNYVIMRLYTIFLKHIYTSLEYFETLEDYNIKQKLSINTRYYISNILNIIIFINQLVVEFKKVIDINQIKYALNSYCYINNYKQIQGYFNNNITFTFNNTTSKPSISKHSISTPSISKMSTSSKPSKIDNKLKNEKHNKHNKHSNITYEIKEIDIFDYLDSLKLDNKSVTIFDIDTYILNQDLDTYYTNIVNSDLLASNCIFTNKNIITEPVRIATNYKNIYAKIEASFNLS
jgi:hypothetical protein